ncbi:hypothetical protein V8C35DRAFT_295884 [Trichoderma chlorosporum]
MDFEDPLARHVLTEHPAPGSSSQFSSAPGSPQQWRDLQSGVDRILRNYTPIRCEDDTAQVFRAFITHLCKDGQVVLMQEILQVGERPTELRQLRNFLVDSILKPLLIAGGKQPQSLAASPFIEAAEAIELSMTEIEPSSRSEQTALKRQCLGRDNHRCVITGMVHSQKLSLATKRPGDISAATECAHIIPFALRKFNQNSAQETAVKTQIWWAIHRYFPFLAGKIGANNINIPANAITLWKDAHGEFGAFRLTFEPTNKVNKYRIIDLGVADIVCRFLPAKVIIEQADPAVPMPESDFLRFHYQVSMIVQVSGIRERFEEAMRENEYNFIYGIRLDGSTDLGHILSSRMLMDV